MHILSNLTLTCGLLTFQHSLYDSKFICVPHGVCLIDFWAPCPDVDLPLCAAWPGQSRLVCSVVALPPSQQTATREAGKGYLLLLITQTKAQVKQGNKGCSSALQLECLSLPPATDFKLNKLCSYRTGLCLIILPKKRLFIVNKSC